MIRSTWPAPFSYYVGDHGLVVDNGQALTPHDGFFSNPTPFSFVLTASRLEDRRAIDDLEESYIDDGVAPENAVSQYDLRRYTGYHRIRFGEGGEFDFQPNDDHSWYVRYDNAGYVELVQKNFLLFRNLDAVEDPTQANPIPIDPNDPDGFLVTTQPTMTLTDERETHDNKIYVVGGRDNWDGVTLDYHAAYSRATFTVDHNIGARFAGPTVPFTYDNVRRKNEPIFSFPTGFNVNDPTQYKLNRITNDEDFDGDGEYSFAANLAIPLHLFGGDAELRFGTEQRFRNKVANEFDQTYDVPPLSLAGLSTPAVVYYDNHYSNGPQISLPGVRNLIRTGVAALTSSSFNQSSYFNAKENIFAEYGEITGEVGPWGYLVGVRVETTNATYGGYVFTNDTPALENRAADYTDAFPTIQFRYRFSPTMQVRATYSTGIARPGFNQNTTAASVDLTQSPVVISRGNPNLRATRGQNFDLSFEAYLPQGEILQLGAFDKEFTDYIVPRIENGITTDPLAPGVLANVTTFLNIPYAYARGVEAAYHQQFVFLPRPWDGFGIESNITLVDSRILEYTPAQSLNGKAQHGLLPGTSKVTWNLAGFYEAYGWDARLAAEYVSPNLFGLGGDRSLDVIQDERLTLDFTSSYQLNKRVQVYFDVKNILNTPLRYYEGRSDRPIQREFYLQTYEAGIRIHL